MGFWREARGGGESWASRERCWSRGGVSLSAEHPQHGQEKGRGTLPRLVTGLFPGKQLLFVSAGFEKESAEMPHF